MSAAPAGWRGRLTLRYRREAGRDGARTVAHDSHEGPLRVLQPLYPEGAAICHHVLVHPPGGVVGGDELQVNVQLGEGTHALITTPGATRFYRSDGPVALQQVQLQLAAGARAEWLPMETIAYAGCHADNRWQAELAPDAELIGWDVLALGLPAAGQGFERGAFQQHVEIPGVWLERGRIAAADAMLRQSPLGWGGHPVLATMWFAAGAALPRVRRDALLDATRELLQADALASTAGVTAVQPSVLVLRVLSPRVEPAMQLLMRVRAAWRALAWGLAGEPPRIWRT